MNNKTLDALRKALMSHGYGPDLMAPNETMGLDETFLSGIEIADLLEMLVARRERIFGSVEVVGQEIARQGYEDVTAAIQATKNVIGQLTMP